MNKDELVKIVAESTSSSQAVVKAIVNNTLEAISTELTNGGAVELKGFGTFSVKETAERQGRNPKTGEQITIPATKRAKFKPSKNILK